MKVASDFHRAGSAFCRESVGPTRHSQRTAQRLLSKKRPQARPENSSGTGQGQKPDRSSFSDAIRLAQQGDEAASRRRGLADGVTHQEVVGRLPAGYREFFTLYDVQGYDHREIAKILGRSVGNSKSQLHKARKRLRALLQGVPSFHARRDRET